MPPRRNPNQNIDIGVRLRVLVEDNEPSLAIIVPIGTVMRVLKMFVGSKPGSGNSFLENMIKGALQNMAGSMFGGEKK